MGTASSWARASARLDGTAVGTTLTVPADIIARAIVPVQRMVDLPPPSTPARYDLVKARHHVDVELI